MLAAASDIVLCEGRFRDNLSEWLRRQTRNLLGFARAGSNPAVVVFPFFLLLYILYVNNYRKMDVCDFD